MNGWMDEIHEMNFHFDSDKCRIVHLTSHFNFPVTETEAPKQPTSVSQRYGRHTTDHTDPMPKKVNLNVCSYLCFETITQLTNATFYSARSMDTSIYTYITKRVWSMVILKVLTELAKVVLKNATVDRTYKRNRKEPVCMVYTCCWAGSPAPSDCPPSRPLSLMLFHLSANNQTPAHSSTPMDMQIMDWTCQPHKDSAEELCSFITVKNEGLATTT